MRTLAFAAAIALAAMSMSACRTVNLLAERAHEIDGMRVIELKSTARANASFSTGTRNLDPTGLIVGVAEQSIAVELEKRMRRLMNTTTLSALAASEVKEGVEPLFRVDDKGNAFFDMQLIDYGISASSPTAPPVFYAIVDGRIILKGQVLWDIRATGREDMPTQIISGGIGNLAALTSLEDVHIQEGIDRAVRGAANALVARLASDRASRGRR
jgi:hypothetical protein